jgi:hypothetical protein
VIIRQFFSNPSVTFTEGDLDTVLRVDVDDLNTITSYDDEDLLHPQRQRQHQHHHDHGDR